MKLSADRFVVIATDGMHRHAQTWLEKHVGMPLPSDEEIASNSDNSSSSGGSNSKVQRRASAVVVSDVTGAFAQLNVQGPRSREVLQRVTETDMSDAAFPFRAAKEVAIGFATVVSGRVVLCVTARSYLFPITH